MRKILTIVLFVMISLFFVKFSHAQNYYTYNTVGVNDNKYSIGVGVWSAELAGDTFAPSTVFTTDLESDLGFGNTKAILTFDFNYRFSNLNGAGVSFFSGSHKAVRTLTRNITLPGDPSDVNIASGRTVFTDINYSAFDLYYRRYFATETNYNFYGLVGVRFNNLSADFSTSTAPLVSTDFNVATAYLGIGGDFKLSENINAFYQAQGLSLSFSGDKINFIEYKLGLEYKFTQNWGLNIGYRYNNTKAEDDFSRSLKVKYQGLTFGISGKF
ncbi:MAG: porin family protein [bacterium]|nr:porin family protein [bacterium]